MRGPRARTVPESLRRYADAFATGISGVTGAPFTPPVMAKDRMGFVQALPVHAVADGTPLEGAELDAWIRRTAELYARAATARGSMQGGFTVERWRLWLDAGGLKAAESHTAAGPLLSAEQRWTVEHWREARGKLHLPAGVDPETHCVDALIAKARASIGASKRKDVSIRDVITFWAEEFLADTDEFLAKNGHAMQWLLKRCEKYGLPGEERAPSNRPRGARVQGQPRVQRGGITVDDVREAEAKKANGLARAMGVTEQDLEDVDDA